MMDVNGHADEDGREQREHVCLNEHDQNLERRDADGEGHRHGEADADAGNRASDSDATRVSGAGRRPVSALPR